MTEVENRVNEDAVAKQIEDLSLGNNGEVSPTVFNSVEEFSVVHPLTHKWTFWYTRPAMSPKEDWSALLKEIVTVTTVEEFWGVFNSIPKIQELQLKSDCSFFKKGIRPEWEDPQNSKGGKLTYMVPKRAAAASDELWMKLLLGIVGGTLDNEEEEIISGAFINVRRGGNRINIWTTTKEKAKVNPLGLRMKKLLGLSENDDIEFSPHDESLVKTHKFYVSR
ncbi:eukaryotic translation initiation factor 4E [Trichomonascus vanleenenianus]|uniref:eukaryotic translation initiation factor 4E n=1 Tax=Trichomonascus vanleenenianus TaxID=2268995 RepID=UPI003ECA8DE8